MAGRQRAELFASADEKPIGSDHETTNLQLGQPGEDGVEIALGTRIDDVDVEPQRAGCCRKVLSVGSRRWDWSG